MERNSSIHSIVIEDTNLPLNTSNNSSFIIHSNEISDERLKEIKRKREELTQSIQWVSLIYSKIEFL